MPFVILALVCSMSLDHTACLPETAVDQMVIGSAQNEIQCGLWGQTTLAANGAALAPRPGLEYLKIMCVRSKKNG